MKNTILYILTVILLITAHNIRAQVGINTSGVAPDSSAMLDVSSTEKGMLVPRMTSDQRDSIAAPANGLLVYDTDEGSFWYYDNEQWNEIGGISSDDLLNALPTADFSCLELIESIEMGGDPFAIEVYGNHAFVIDAESLDLKIIDISNKNNPYVQTSIGLSSSPTGIAVTDTYAYTTDHSTDSLTIIDISDLSLPIVVSTIEIGDFPLSLATVGNYVYVLDFSDGDLRVIDITNPSSPIQVNQMPVGGNPLELIIEGNYAYFTDLGEGELNILDISDPSNPSLVGSIDAGSYPRALSVAGNYAYVADAGFNELNVVDVTDPSSPSLVGSVGIGTFTVSAKTIGDYVVLADNQSDDLKIIDISNATAPVMVDSLILTGRPRNMDVSGNYAIVIDQSINDLKVVQLSCVPTIGINPMDGEFITLEDSDHQKIDTLSINGNTLEISLENDNTNAFSIDLSAFKDNTDNQEINYFTLDGSTLFISLENDSQSERGVDLGDLEDDLGNHTASQNIQLSNFTISKDGDDEGISIADDGSVAINSSGSSPDPSSMLDVSSINKGLLIPRMSTSDRQAIDDPATGLLVFDTDKSGFWFYTGTDWVEITADFVAELQDEDNDTKVEVERFSDEDVIRFRIEGTEYFKMDKGRLEFSNNGSSVFIGDDAGVNDDLSNANVFIGTRAGNENTTGRNSVAIGAFAYQQAIDASSNVSIGYAAARNTTSGRENITLGLEALLHNQTGSSNVMIGHNAGRGRDSSNISENVVLGSNAGEKLEGNNNTLVGHNAGKSLGEASGNVFLGNNAGSQETGDNKLYIANSSTSSPLIFGDFEANSLQINGQLNIDGAYNLPLLDGNVGQILSTNGSGSAAWIDAPTFQNTDDQTIDIFEFNDNILSISIENDGQDSLTVDLSSLVDDSTLISDADGDTKIQVEETNDEDIIRFDLKGTEFMRLDSGRIELLNTGNSIFIGNNAGVNDDYGDNENVFVGDEAGKENTSGSANVFLGYGSGIRNTTGSSNVFLGHSTGFENTSGLNNVFIGWLAGLNNTTGSSNLFLGQRAGNDNLSGSNNVFIGHEAGYFEEDSNKLYIESSSSPSPLIYGDFAADSLQINGKLNINGEYNFPENDGVEGQVLRTNGSGDVSWSNPSVLADGDGDTKVQVEEGVDDNVIRFDLDGEEFMRLDSGRIELVNNGRSVYIGQEVGYNETFSQADNVFLGYQAGKDNTSGNDNIFIGSFSGEENTTGEENVFIGEGSGSDNIGGDENVYIGKNAGRDNVDGSSNVVIGHTAGQNNDSGTQNTYIGDGSGYFSDGNGSVFLGYQAGYNEDSNDKLYIENSSSSSPLIYGDFALDIVELNGNVGIGRNPSTNTLEVNGNASKSSAGDWLANSDARLKKNISQLNSQQILSQLLALRGITYEWNDTITGNDRPEGIQYGFTAQNIEKVFPSLVSEDNLGYLQTSYGTYDAMYVEAIRALKEEIDALKEENAILKAKVETTKNLLEKVEKLEAEMSKVDQLLQSINRQNAQN